MKDFEELSEIERIAITDAQVASIQSWCARNPSGESFEYLGRHLVAFQGVYPPSEISRPLVEQLGVIPGDVVLDAGCGSGVISIFAAFGGASRVVALDVNPTAVANTRFNSELHGVDSIVDARESDLFSAVGSSEQFSLVAANLPFRHKAAASDSEAAIWDSEFSLNRRFFSEVRRVLAPGGRIRMAQANFGNIREFLELARSNGFDVLKIGELRMKEPDKRIFYALEVRDLTEK